MRLLPTIKLCCLLLILAVPAISGAAQPSGKTYGPVSPKETLGEIGQRVRGEWRIPLKYMVKALFELNPASFSAGDINSLMVGSTLQTPNLEALSKEVPELLAAPPKPPAGTNRITTKASTQETAPTRPRSRQTITPSTAIKLPHSSLQQLDNIKTQLAKNQHNAEVQKKLLKINQRRTLDLQASLDVLVKQQETNSQIIKRLSSEIRTRQSNPITPPRIKQPTPSKSVDNKQELYLALLLLPILLSIIAIFIARKSNNTSTAQPDPVPAVSPDLETTEEPSNEVFNLVEPEAEEISWTDETECVDNEDTTQIIKPDPGTAATQVTKPKSAAAEETGTDEWADIFAEADKVDTTENNIDQISVVPDLPPINDHDEKPEAEADSAVFAEEEIEATSSDNEIDEPSEIFQLPDFGDVDADADEEVSDELLAFEISNAHANLEEVTLAPAEENIDSDIQNLKTTADELEAKLSAAHLHIDMGDLEHASKTLDGINLQEYPDFTDKVNEIRAIIQSLTIIPEKEGTEPSLEALSGKSLNEEQPSEALEKVLRQQLKLAYSYYTRNDLKNCKVYVAKILRCGIPRYSEKALGLLKDIEQNEDSSTRQQLDFEELSIQSTQLEKTVIVSPQNNPNITKEPDHLKKTQPLQYNYRDAIPKDISGRFEAYSDDEEGTKLALAYLFLDLNEIDTAIELFKEVLDEGDEKLAAEAKDVLAKLV